MSMKKKPFGNYRTTLILTISFESILLQRLIKICCVRIVLNRPVSSVKHIATGVRGLGFYSQAS